MVKEIGIILAILKKLLIGKVRGEKMRGEFFIKKSLANFLLWVGGGLLVLSLGGELLVGSTVNPARVKSVDDVLFRAQTVDPNFFNLSEEKKLLILFDILTKRFSHCLADRHTVATNWILWGLGFVHPVLGVTWAPDYWLKKAECLECSQISYLLMMVAIKSGVVVRHVGLMGHVVMEAWYEGEWHMFDPDVGVIPRHNGKVLSVRSLAYREELIKKFYRGSKEETGMTILSRENNSFVSYPVGAYFEWKSQMMFYVEKILEIVKYVLPLAMIVAGIILKRRGNVPKVSS